MADTHHQDHQCAALPSDSPLRALPSAAQLLPAAPGVDQRQRWFAAGEHALITSHEEVGIQYAQLKCLDWDGGHGVLAQEHLDGLDLLGG